MTFLPILFVCFYVFLPPPRLPLLSFLSGQTVGPVAESLSCCLFKISGEARGGNGETVRHTDGAPASIFLHIFFFLVLLPLQDIQLKNHSPPQSSIHPSAGDPDRSPTLNRLTRSRSPRPSLTRPSPARPFPLTPSINSPPTRYQSRSLAALIWYSVSGKSSFPSFSSSLSSSSFPPPTIL